MLSHECSSKRSKYIALLRKKRCYAGATKVCVCWSLSAGQWSAKLWALTPPLCSCSYQSHGSRGQASGPFFTIFQNSYFFFSHLMYLILICSGINGFRNLCPPFASPNLCPSFSVPPTIKVSVPELIPCSPPPAPAL